MSRRREAQARISVLADLRDVFDSMRTLSLVEMAKLNRSEAARYRLQQELAAIAQATAPYFQALHAPRGPRLFLLVGSERGFCAGFNDAVLQRWERIAASDDGALAIVVGSILAEKLEASTAIASTLAGPTIVEDIDAVLIAVLRHVSAVERRLSVPIALSTIANGRDGIEVTAILPFEPPKLTHAGVCVPELNLAPNVFVRAFADSYVDAALHGVFATSLLSENRARLVHMTTAIDRLDETTAALRRQVHRLRQEEITQEVETILLGTLL
jgi:F-type H+-transporting ATPase subunit gamma